MSPSPEGGPQSPMDPDHESAERKPDDRRPPSSSRQGGGSRLDPRHAPSSRTTSRGVARDDGYLRKSQRSRRPTNYTEQYTPPSDLVELRRETLARGGGGAAAIKGGNSRMDRRKSLDKSEGDSEHRAEAHRAAADQHQEKALRASAGQRQLEMVQHQQQLAQQQLQRKDSRGGAGRGAAARGGRAAPVI
ncbi:hypothetical protein THAOC_33898, partial [Thalassiosira oceanica]